MAPALPPSPVSPRPPGLLAALRPPGVENDCARLAHGVPNDGLKPRRALLVGEIGTKAWEGDELGPPGLVAGGDDTDTGVAGVAGVGLE